MKYLILICFGFWFLPSIFSQDIITMKNGSVVNGRVVEITTTSIKFKKTSEGPLYTVNITDVSSITYENGTKENYASISTPNTSTNPVTSNKNGKSDDDDFLIPVKKYSGPRVGLTYLGDGTSRTKIAEAFNRTDITPFVSQFGWQFETRIFTLDNGAAGLFEFIPMIGGIEQGLFLPSATGVIGFRAANGIEFGIGPTASLSGFGLVLVAGTSFKVGKVTFPINVAFTPNIKKMLPDSYEYDPITGQQILIPGTSSNSGFRLSFLMGFNSRKE